MDYQRYSKWAERQLEAEREFAENIPIGELFDAIRRKVNIPDLKFDYKINYKTNMGFNRYLVKFKSQIIDESQLGIMRFGVEDVVIDSYNGEISHGRIGFDEDFDYDRIYPIHYWVRIDLSYSNQSDGYNGTEIGRATYDGNTWSIEFLKE